MVIYSAASIDWNPDPVNREGMFDNVEKPVMKTVWKNGIPSVCPADNSVELPVFSTDPADYIGPVLSV